MSIDHLPQFADPVRLAQASARVSGYVQLMDLVRLHDLLVGEVGEVFASVHFSYDEQRYLCVTGQLQAQLPVCCQRCMQQMWWPVAHDFCLSPVATEAEAESLPNHYEPWLVTSRQVSLWAMVEDELLLCFPVAAMHPVKDRLVCGAWDIEEFRNGSTEDA